MVSFHVRQASCLQLAYVYEVLGVVISKDLHVHNSHPHCPSLLIYLAWFWGDPHLTTLDGRAFTFNGLGEYTLVTAKTETLSFVLQGRTELVENSAATQFIGFAFGVTEDFPVEVYYA